MLSLCLRRSRLPKGRSATALALRFTHNPSTFTTRGLPQYTAPASLLARDAEDMLQGAVFNYRAEQAKKDASQSTSSGLSRASSIGSDNPGYKMPLKPTTSSLLNQSNDVHGRKLKNVAGVKRTSGGVPKIMTGSFDDDMGSQKRPILVGTHSPEKRGHTATSPLELFDENDFDDDIELELQLPTTRNPVTYPKLPSQPQQAAEPIPKYPTLPTAQPTTLPATPLAKWGDAVGRSIDTTPTSRNDPRSSAPVPWSSSPAEHMIPARRSDQLSQYAFHDPQPAKPIRGYRPEEPQVKRKRQLPWADAQPQEKDEEISTKPSSDGLHTRQSTKDSRTSNKTHQLWNTSASAVKEGLKKHREETKKALVKTVEGTEESIQKAKSTQKRPARVFLSEEQQHILDLVIEKKQSVFFTGSAGTGKSVLMREIISSLRKRYIREPDRVAVTASTGLAACNIGGVTLHSFAGIGLGKEDPEALVRKIKKNQKAKHRWMRTKVLVMDEVSMLDGELFDKLEQVARQIRGNGRAFGGIQLVITGDFFQLPPVPDNNRMAKFAFDATTWKTSIEHTIALHHVFRQKDPIFAGMLNEMREGRLTDSSIKAFKNLERPLEDADALVATELFPTRAEVDKANSGRLSMLQGETFPFFARDGGSITDTVQRSRLLQNIMAPETIVLKKGAQVMLIKNVDEHLVNGSIGQVMGFKDEHDFNVYQARNDGQPESSADTPARPSSSDETLPVRSLLGVSTATKWPLVRFTLHDGTFRDLLCQPESWTIELPNGEVQASRAQIPLILAWALSIHKAQGQTLNRVKVDLGKVFEKGQAYVALSRATSMSGLQVLRFDPRKVNAHERVRTFYSNLARIELAGKTEARSGKGATAAGSNRAGDSYEKRFVQGEVVDLS